MKNVSKKAKYLLLLAILLCLVGVGLSISAEDEAGKIILSKEATKVTDDFDETNLEYGRLANVTLTVGGNPYSTQESTMDELDIVLVLDSSGSMAENAEGGETHVDKDRRITGLKDSAKDFVNTMLDSEGNVQIALVEFDNKVQQTINFTSYANRQTLISAIESMEADGGTNLQAGIAKADELLDSAREKSQKMVIILTDGIPTFYNYTYTTWYGKEETIICGNGSSDSTTNDDYRCPNIKPSEAAKTSLDELKKSHAESDVYTITFGNERAAAEKLAAINPVSKDGSEPVYKNSLALSAEDLKKEFEKIQTSTKNVIGTNGVVVDIIPAEFELTDDAKTSLAEQGATYVLNEDGTTTITWNVGDVVGGQGKEKTLSYNVVAKDLYHGSIYTNKTTNYESATLTVTIPDENPYEEYKDLKNNQATLKFEAPTANIPAITNDDHYNDNSSYIGVAESTINGESILTNDIDDNLYADKETDNVSISVSDKIVVELDDNTIKVDDNKYQIKKDNKVIGTLIMNDDGTFTFVSEENVSGEVSFNYHIETTIEKNNNVSYVYSNTSTVTLKINPREKISVSGKKVWNDNNDQDGIRPKSITVVLKANGVAVSELVLKDGNWSYEFTDLYKYAVNHENDSLYAIKYTVEEKTNVPGYTTSIEGTTITNTHIPATIDLSLEKTWKDNNDQDGKRPESITVRLFANDTLKEVVTVSASDNWKYTFTGLAKYEAGKEISYTIKEDSVDGYTTEISGYNITNTHEIEKIDISGKKTWVDNDNQDGKRPESITVRLFANGEEEDSIVVTADDNWEYTFTGLDKYKAGQEINYTVKEDSVEGYTTEVSGYNITNTHEIEKIDISGEKTWVDNDNQDGKRPESITVRLFANGEEEDSIVVTADDNWEYTFTGLDKYKAGQEINYTVKEDSVEGYTTEVSGYNITNTHEIEKIDVSGKKTWVDNDDQDGKRPESITVRLFANGEEEDSIVVTANDNWKYTFTGLDKYKAGQEINYTVKEDSVDGYTTSIEGTTITNTHIPEVIDVAGKKLWDDNFNQDGKRPGSITVRLFADGEEKDSIVVTANDDWKYTFTGLAKYKAGQEINYTVKEDIVDGYTTEVSGYNITNTHEIEKIDISGKKIWEDNFNQDGKRPESITVRLFANGEEKDAIVVTANDNWEYTFTGFVKYEAGHEINYTVKEDSVAGYTTEVSGYNITNTHEIEKIDLSFVKIWEDNNNQDGARPSSIVVNLLANGSVVNTVEVSALDGWKYEFKNLDKYKNGAEVVYTVSEEAVKDYTSKVDGMTITNTHTPEVTEVSGMKTWKDNNDQDGKRPESITVNLLADGVKKQSIAVTAENDWKYTFTNLDRYANGKEIKYTVSEETVSGYTTEVSGYDITNTYIPEVTTVSGKKTWVDSNNQDGIRPDKITVNLLRDGELIKSIDVTAANDWEYTFTDLDKYRDGGQIINYTVTENAVAGYDTTIEGYDITNTHTPGTTEVSGKKTWVDSNNQDGIRPNEILVKLLADGKEIDSKSVTEADGWAYTFANLPEFAAGKKIVYTIFEEEVSGYQTSVNGFDLINTHVPELIEVSGVKTWDDNNNQDGMRPTTITVRLLANNEEVLSKVVTADTEWKYVFTDVPKYANGQEIVYTVKEDSVDGYTGTVDGMNITNKHTPITISINGEKVWVDDNDIDGLRPESITVRLLADLEEVGFVKVSADNNWQYTFNDLPKYKEGKEINYTVIEDEVEHYEMSTDKDNKFIIVNTHSPKNVTVSGTKTWVDTENKYGRPESITVTLTGKIGEKVVASESKKVTEADDWKYEFTDLPEYREGILVVYTVDEDDVRDYDKAVNGYNITNTYNPETLVISGTKTWADNLDQDGIRPDSITINLLANGEVIATTEVTADNNWTFEFENVVKYANGVEITYTVEEVSVEGYTTEITGYDVVNHHTPETVSYTVSKVWNDQDNNDNIRPESITVRLIQDGIEIASQVIGEDDDWTYSFENLPKYRDGGITIVYQIVEDEVKGYTTTITQSVLQTNTNVTEVVITNTHENEKKEITINKVWDDSNNEQGKRPTSITVVLTGKVEDEVVVTEEIEVTEDMNWSYTLDNYDKYLNGVEILYEIVEKEVPDYITFYDGYTITNSYKAIGEITPPNTGIVIEYKDNNSYIMELVISLLITLTAAISLRLSKVRN